MKTRKVMRMTVKKKVIGISIAIGILLGVSGHIALSNKAVFLGTAASRAKDIYVSIVAASFEGEVPCSFWPRTDSSLKKIGEETDNISEMMFENSSDYFTVLLDSENMDNTQIWNPYVVGLDWSNFAGGGVPPQKGAGRLTAKNNIWSIAANISYDISDNIPDDIPVIVSRNVDPDSLIPREGDISQQRIRPSSTYTTPFGDRGFVLVQKGGKVIIGSWKKAELHLLYQTDIQDVRSAFQTVKYLMP